MGSLINYFHFSKEDILYGYSYTNIVMLAASIRSIVKKDDKTPDYAKGAKPLSLMELRNKLK